MTIVRANGRLCSKALRDIISPCLPRIPPSFNSIQISHSAGIVARPPPVRASSCRTRRSNRVISHAFSSKYPVGFLLLQVGNAALDLDGFDRLPLDLDQAEEPRLCGSLCLRPPST